MMPSPTMLGPDVIPTGLLGPAVETGLVAIGLIVLAVLVGLCVRTATRWEAAEPRRASLYPFAPPTRRGAGQAKAA